MKKLLKRITGYSIIVLGFTWLIVDIYNSHGFIGLGVFVLGLIITVILVLLLIWLTE